MEIINTTIESDSEAETDVALNIDHKRKPYHSKQDVLAQVKAAIDSIMDIEEPLSSRDRELEAKNLSAQYDAEYNA